MATGNRRLLQFGSLALGALLIAWTARQIAVADMLAAIRQLRAAEVGLLLVLNALIVALLSGRWWLILRGTGHQLTYGAVAAYRLVAFGISYFTPGPHFGGEPAQVWLIHRRHGVPLVDASATVAVDKLLELLVNFGVLTAGIAFVTWTQPALTPAGWPVIAATVTAAIPLLAVLLLARGWPPLTPWLRPWWPRRWQRTIDWLADLERASIRFVRGRPAYLAGAIGWSSVAWLAIVLEYWLLLRFLGVALSPAQALAALVAARVAYLAPTPAALGAFEASQVIALGALGYPPAAGLALVLIVRLRDVCLGAAGLLLGTRLQTKAAVDPIPVRRRLRRRR